MLEPASSPPSPNPTRFRVDGASAASTTVEPVDVIVVGGGGSPPPGLRALLPNTSVVICADRGYAHALALGLTPSMLIGDFDSLDAQQLADARAAGLTVEVHPSDKDATDLELALDRAVSFAALEAGLLRLTVVATPDVGERIDHLLSQLALLAAPKYADAELTAWFGTACVHIAHPLRAVAFHGRPGELVTLLAIGGDATDVSTTGLRFPLRHESLSPFSTRGVSNILSDPAASITLAGGCLAIVRPHALKDPR